MERRAHRVLCALIVAAAVAIPWQRAWARSPAATEARPHHICIFDRSSLWTQSGSCRPRARLYPVTVRGSVRHAIYDSALIFGIPYDILLHIAECESGLNPRANNGEHLGLFQFLPETFSRGAHALRHETGIVARTYWSSLDSAYVAGYLFATGYARRWSCE